MRLDNTNSNSFKAKFLNSESLRLVAEYSVEKGKFSNLNQARKNIDNAHLTTRLRFDMGENNGIPFVTFTRYIPKTNVIIPKSMADYKLVKTVKYEAAKKCNILKFALEKLIKLGNNAPKNNMYQNVVVKK